eukprot:3260737-Pleurochrysis_carterae.AAC.2
MHAEVRMLETDAALCTNVRHLHRLIVVILGGATIGAGMVWWRVAAGCMHTWVQNTESTFAKQTSVLFRFMIYHRDICLTYLPQRTTANVCTAILPSPRPLPRAASLSHPASAPLPLPGPASFHFADAAPPAPLPPPSTTNPPQSPIS